MNKKTGIIIGCISFVLVIALIISASVYLTHRPEVSSASLLVITDGKEKTVRLSDLSLSEVSGTTVNGKGEEKTISGQGVNLADIVGSEGFDEVTVTSDDAYSATVRADEIGNAFLLVEEESFRLVVFGDDNSKRNVKNVVSIEVK